MAEQVIDGAIEHVLANRHSSLRELVTNAIDACKEGPPIGQFGMGFFSTLTYLDGGQITVETRTQTEAYKLTLFKVEGRIFLQFDRIEEGETGTTVIIEGSFSDKDIAKIQKDLQRLKIVQGAQIAINGKSFGEGPLVTVTLEKRCLRVQDWGTGIPLKTACTALLVPSSSSKRQAPSGAASCELTQYRENESADTRFLVGVNGAVVIDLPLDYPHTQDLLVRLPNNTPLTLDRKSVQFAGPNDRTICALKQLIRRAVAEAVEKPERLALLHEGLIAWEASAALPLSLSRFLQEEFDTFVQESGLTPYPLSHEKQLRPILKSLGIEKTFAASPRLLRFDYRPAVALITETANAREDLVDLPVVFVPDELLTRISDCGLYSCLFAPSSALEEIATKQDLAFYLATRYSEYGRRIAPHPLLGLKSEKSSRGPGLFFAAKRRSQASLDDSKLPVSQLMQLTAKPAFKYVSDEILSQLWQKHEKWFRNVMTNWTCVNCTFVGPQYSNYKKFVRAILPNCQPTNQYDMIYALDDGSYWRLTWLGDRPTPVEMRPSEVLRLYLAHLLQQRHLLSPETEWPLYRNEALIWPFTGPVSLDQLEMVLAACIHIHGALMPPPPPSLARLRRLDQIGLYYLDEGETPSRELLESTEQLISFQEAAIQLTGDSLRARSLELAHLEHLAKQRLSNPLQVARLERMRPLILGLFRNYLSIPDREFPHIYGKTRDKEELRSVAFDLRPCAQIADLLALFQDNTSRLEKVLRFIEIDFEVELSPGKLRKDLEQWERIYLPCADETGTISVLRALSPLVHPSHLAQLVDHSHSPEQLVAGCSLLLNSSQDFDASLFLAAPGTPEHARVYGAIEVAMLVGIPQIAALNEKVRLITSDHSGEDMLNALKQHHPRDFEPLTQLFVDHLGENTLIPKRTELLDPSLDRALSKSTPFTAKQLFNAQGKGVSTLLKEERLDEARDTISAASRDTELRIYHHAIEAGSARAIEEAFFLEALQNSLDAAKGDPDAQIKFEAAMQGDNHVILSVSDTVGFSGLNVLLGAFLIPNQSPKRGSDSVGQMGNGSFQVYRKAKRVIVKTRFQGGVALLSIRPLRNDGKVEDLALRCVFIDDPDFQGTQIDVRLLAQDPAQAELQALRAASFVREVISATDTSVQLSVGDERLAGIDRDHVVTGLGEPASRFLKLKRPSQRGQLLTGGLPAGHLEKFLVAQGITTREMAEEYSRGWCLELPTDAYHPVQSRSEVRLKKGRKQELRALFGDWLLYRATFDPATYEPAFRRIPHAESDVPTLNQVKPLQPHLLLDHQASFLKAPLRTMLFDAYDTLVADLEQLQRQFLAKPVNQWYAVVKAFPIVVDRRFNDWKQEQMQRYGTNPMARRFVKRVLIRWFEPKVAAFAKMALPSLESLKAANPSLRSQEEEVAHKAAYEAVSTTLETAPVDPGQYLEWGRKGIELYCNAVAKLNGMGPLKADFEYDPDAQRSASYRRGRIKVNLAFNPLSQILDSLSQLARGIPLDDSTDPAGLFLVQPGTAGTLNHELEHARRHEQCVFGGVHGPSTDAEGVMASFEACAASFARKAHRLGAFESVRDGMRTLTGSDKIDDIDALISSLKSLETNHPRELQEWFTDNK